MKQRIHSIDIVRGLIMIIMTLDHVRDLLGAPTPSPTNMQTTTVILFFTRWITHFCAPTFVCLSGVSVFLAGQRRSRGELITFLLKRGAWLILSDMLIISLLFTFDPLYHVVVFEVLTAIGAGMIILALLIRAPVKVIGTIGLLIIFGHNLLDHVQIPQHTVVGNLMTVFFTAVAAFFPLGGDRVLVQLYAIIPWTGAMLLGYALGSLFKAGFSQERRRKILLLSGLTFVALFIILRLINSYGDQSPWAVQRNAAHTFISFLNASKQPPSLLFMCMTLGPMLIFLSFAERICNWFSSVCQVYGNVPYFYFIMHLTVIRVINFVLVLVQGLPIKFKGFPLVWQAEGFGYPFWSVFLFWPLVVIILYFPCKWYGQYKRTRKHWWLSYI